MFINFGALIAPVPLFWGLIWHWSDVWPCCDRHCRSEWERNWPSYMLRSPKPPPTVSDAIVEAQWRCSCVKMMHQPTWRLQEGGYRSTKAFPCNSSWVKCRTCNVWQNCKRVWLIHDYFELFFIFFILFETTANTNTTTCYSRVAPSQNQSGSNWIKADGFVDSIVCPVGTMS